MARFRKDVLAPGTYALADGRRVTYTRADVKHMARRVNDMIASGLSIPTCWEHQDDALPMTPGQRLAMQTQSTLGWVESAEETPSGKLAMIFEAPNEADAQRLAAVRFVSPEIRLDETDGNGRLWEGRSITHLAVTPRPVQMNQEPFQRLSRNSDRKPVRLSLGDLQMDPDMTPDTPPADATPAPAPAPADKGGRTAKAVQAVIASLEMLLHDLTDGDPATPADPEKADEPEELDEPITEAPSPVMLSLQARVLDMERDKLTGRINALGVPRSIKTLLLGRVKSERLSLTPKSDLARCDLLVEVAAYERLGSGFFPPTGVREVPPPAETRDEMTDEQKKDIEARAARVSRAPSRNGK